MPTATVEDGEIIAVEVNGRRFGVTGLSVSEYDELEEHVEWMEEHLVFPEANDSQFDEGIADDGGDVEEWTSEELIDFFDSTTSLKQQVFLRTLATAGGEWVPKRQVASRLEEETGQEFEDYTGPGILGPMRNRAPDDKEPFWRSDVIQGERQYCIREPYRDIVVGYWNGTE